MRVIKPLVLFGIGGLLYVLIELIWRGYSHWTMFLLGGLCFFYAGMQNEYVEWNYPLWRQIIRVTVFITAVELATGCIINLWLKWDVWDYSHVPFNVLGQICLPYMVLWMPLAAAGIILDDYLRYWLFGEEKPHYRLF